MSQLCELGSFMFQGFHLKMRQCWDIDDSSITYKLMSVSAEFEEQAYQFA